MTVSRRHIPALRHIHTQHYSSNHMLVAASCVHSITLNSVDTHAGTTQTLPDYSRAIMDALCAPFDEASFPKAAQCSTADQAARVTTYNASSFGAITVAQLTSTVSRLVCLSDFWFSPSAGLQAVDIFTGTLANRIPFCASLYPVVVDRWLWST